MRVSLLDRSRTRSGESDADAVTSTVDRAVRAERLGFDRFWVAEHHAVPGIASAAPTVLLAAIGARTKRIRLGTGGVMLPNHNPFVVAEQALLLEALHPGRIDLGIGASLGFTAAVRRALQTPALAPGEHARALGELQDYLAGTAEVTPRPQVPPPPILILAIQDGLRLAAELGLPAVIGGRLLREADATAGYVADFRPSASHPAPQLIASVDVAIAATEERARELLLPEAWAMATSRETGVFPPLQPVTEVRRLLQTSASAKKRAAVERWFGGAVTGTHRQVATALADLTARTGASELLLTTSTYDRDDLARLDESLAALQHP